MNLSPDVNAESMTAEQVLHELSTCGNRIPVAALHQAAAHREFLIKPLLTALASHVEQTRNPLAKWDDSQSLPDMAMYLLAQFREPRAFAHYAELCRLPEERCDYWLGDMLLEDFPGFLASSCGGDPVRLQTLAEDASVFEYARWTAVNALIVLVAEGDWPRAAMIDWLAQRIAVEPRRADNPFWSEHLASAVMDLAATELLPVVQQGFADNLMNEYHVTQEEVEDACKKNSAETLQDTLRSHHYIADAAADMAWQSRYRDDEDEQDIDQHEDEAWADEPIEEPFVRVGPKIGRNDLCPCGSGKKYKKCCLNEPFAPSLESGFGS